MDYKEKLDNYYNKCNSNIYIYCYKCSNKIFYRDRIIHYSNCK